MLLWTESCQRIRRTGLPPSSWSARYWSANSYSNWSATGGRNNGPCILGGAWAAPLNPAPSGNVYISGFRWSVNADEVSTRIANMACGLRGVTGAHMTVVADGWPGRIWVGRGTVGAWTYTELATTANGVVTPNVLHYLAWKVTIDPVNGSVIVYFDGVEVPELTLTGINTRGLASATWDTCMWGSTYGVWGTHPICDMYAADGTDPSGAGHDLHDVIPEAQVDYLPANGNGYISEFVGNDGNSVNNFELVDDNGGTNVNPDEDTTYIQSTNPARDAFTKAACADPAVTVVGASVYARARKPDAGTALMRVGVRSGSTDKMSDVQSISLDYSDLYLSIGHDPADGALSRESFDALQLVVEKV